VLLNIVIELTNLRIGFKHPRKKQNVINFMYELYTLHEICPEGELLLFAAYL
jgi:hypothetical protein